MSIGWAIVLGLVQGLTEFLPVSSSGHLVIIQSLVPGFPSEPLAFDLMLHAATLLALLAFFRRDLAGVLLWTAGRPGPGALVRSPAEARHFLRLLTLATAATGAIGLSIEDAAAAMFARPRTAAAMILVTGLLLASAELAGRRRAGSRAAAIGQVGWRAALLIGIAQGVAVVPGISRSGATIAAALFLGLERDLAVRLSFLLSIPAVGGAVLLKSGDLACLPAGLWPAVAAGSLAAAVSGFLALAGLLALVRRRSLLGLAGYCLVAGTAALLFLP